MNRRQFIKNGAIGVALLGAGIIDPGRAGAEESGGNEAAVIHERVKLGDTGLSVPIMAMGTGTVGWGGSSNQTRMGMSEFVKLARNAIGVETKGFPSQLPLPLMYSLRRSVILLRSWPDN